jgi:hypothetical protein
MDENPPAGIVDRLGERGLRQTPDVQVFVGDKVVGPEQIGRELPGEVQALVPDMGVGLLDEDPGVESALAAAFLGREGLVNVILVRT